MGKGLQGFEPIFGKANTEFDTKTSTNTTTTTLFHLHALDANRLRIHATDFHSYTWESLLSVQRLDDMRDSIGVGGSWSEFVDYLSASFKSDDVKLVVRDPTLATASAPDHGVSLAKLVARRCKGMPQISISLDRLTNTFANDAMGNLSLELFKAFKKQERCHQLTENLSAQKETNGGIQNQFGATLSSNKHKLRKTGTEDIVVPFVNPASKLNQITVSNAHDSPEKPSTQAPIFRKTGHRVAPASCRAKVRGAVLGDTEDAEEETTGGIQNQLDANLSSKIQNLQKTGTEDKVIPFVNPSSDLSTVTVSNTHDSREKPSTQAPISRKASHRVAPSSRRAKGRGAILDDTEDSEHK